MKHAEQATPSYDPAEDAVRRHVTRYEPDDEIVTRGNVHIERMDTNAFWVRAGDVVIWFRARGRITMTPYAEPLPPAWRRWLTRLVNRWRYRKYRL